MRGTGSKDPRKDELAPLTLVLWPEGGVDGLAAVGGGHDAGIGRAAGGEVSRPAQNPIFEEPLSSQVNLSC